LPHLNPKAEDFETAIFVRSKHNLLTYSIDIIMKKLNYYLLAFVTAIIMLTSCGKNGTVGPQVPTCTTCTPKPTGDTARFVNYTLNNSTGISTFQATFTLNGVSTPYNFPSTGSTTVSLHSGTYTTVSVNAVGSETHKFTMGTRKPLMAHNATFNTVIVTTASPDLTLSIQ
jgi:hypothetical protein